MEQKTEIVENFDDFTKELEANPDQELEIVPKLQQEFDEKKYIEEQVLEDGVGLKCAYCSWSGHANAKDKKRGLKNHMKKCKHNPKNNGEELPPSPLPKKKKVNIEILPPKIDKVVDEVEMVSMTKDEQREKLIGDLDILKIKFDTIPFNWNYNNNSSVAHLKRQKALFMRVLNDTAGTQAMFKLLVLSSKAVEKVCDISNVVDLDGYAQDVNNAEEEIYPILKNLVDTGVLSVSHLTPELRLGMIMGSLAISRIEKNKVQSKSFLDKEDDSEWE